MSGADKKWILIEPKTRAACKQDVSDIEGRDVKPFGMHHCATSAEDILMSFGFVGCHLLLVHNEETGETTGFHINPDSGLSDEQRQKLQELHAQAGIKHGLIIKGRAHYMEVMPGARPNTLGAYTDRIVAEVMDAIPDLKPHGVLVIAKEKNVCTQRGVAPIWHFRFDARTGEAVISETLIDHKKRELAGPVIDHGIHLFPDIFAKRHAAQQPDTATATFDAAINPQAKAAHL